MLKPDERTTFDKSWSYIQRILFLFPRLAEYCNGTARYDCQSHHENTGRFLDLYKARRKGVHEVRMRPPFQEFPKRSA